MRDIVEHPMRGHQAADEKSAPAIAPDRKINEAQERSPSQLSDEAVRNWVRSKIERRGREKAGHDAHLFEAEKEQDRPQHVCELRGEHQCAREVFGAAFFAAKANPKWPRNMLLLPLLKSLQLDSISNGMGIVNAFHR